MSEHPRDEEELQAFLAGESALSRRYKESSDEQPPVHVDAAILAASRWAVGADKYRGSQRRAGLAGGGAKWRSSSFTRWSIPLATAAVVVVAATLTLLIERDPELDRIYQRHDAAVSDEPDSDQQAALVALAPQLEEEESVAQKKEAIVSASGKAIPPQAATEQKTSGTKTKELTGRVASSSGALTRDDDAGNTEASATASMEDMARPQQALQERAAPSIAKRQRSNDATPVLGTPAQTPVASVPALDTETAAPEMAAVDTPAADGPAPAEEVAPAEEQAAAGRIAAAEPEFVETPAESAALAPPAPIQTQRDPAQWIADIEEQLERGNVELARAAVKKFRSRYPDYELPDRLAQLLPETE